MSKISENFSEENDVSHETPSCENSPAEAFENVRSPYDGGEAPPLIDGKFKNKDGKDRDNDIKLKNFGYIPWFLGVIAFFYLIMIGVKVIFGG